MKPKEPFLEDEEGNGVSRTAFRRMRKAEKRALMVEWFGQNFEDPVHRTSYMTSEGGYLWNHGGPYDAREQLYDMFGDIVSESQIEDVANELESDGTDQWAGTDRHEYQDEYDEASLPQSSPFDSFSEFPTEKYGSQEDLEERDRVRFELKSLLDALDERKPVGIGHNNPPEDLIETPVIEEMRSEAIALEAEFRKPNPSISLVKKLGAALHVAAVATAKWLGRKADLAVDVAIKTSVPAVVLSLTYNDALQKVLASLISWLGIVARSLF